jgi:integral membrane protein
VLKTPIDLLRVVGIIEGISFLLLLGIAMPLKYFADIHEAVTIAGWIHGLFFVLYVLVIGYVTLVVRWSFGWIVGSLLASVIPFGPFVLDKRLRKIRFD